MATPSELENKIIERHQSNIEVKVNAALDQLDKTLNEVNPAGKSLTDLWIIISSGIEMQDNKLVYTNPTELETHVKDNALNHYLDGIGLHLADKKT